MCMRMMGPRKNPPPTHHIHTTKVEFRLGIPNGTVCWKYAAASRAHAKCALVGSDGHLYMRSIWAPISTYKCRFAAAVCTFSRIGIRRGARIASVSIGVKGVEWEREIFMHTMHAPGNFLENSEM